MQKVIKNNTDARDFKYNCNSEYFESLSTYSIHLMEKDKVLCSNKCPCKRLEDKIILDY